MFIKPTYCRCHKNTIPKTKTPGYTIIYLFYIKKNKVKLLFECSTGSLVSYLSSAYVGSAVTINIPTFLKKRKKMSRKTVQRDRDIPSKLVDLEQVIDLASTLKIITIDLHRTEANLAGGISFVVVFLTMQYSDI